MPLNDDPVLGRLTDPKQYPGDSQEDLNAELLMVHDQNLLLKYIRKHVGFYTIKDILDNLRDCDDNYWEKVLRRIIQEYSLGALEVYLSEVKIDHFSRHVQSLFFHIKTRCVEDISEGVIKSEISREDFEKYLKETQTDSILLIWGVHYMTGEDYSKFSKRLFEESKEPLFGDGDDTE